MFDLLFGFVKYLKSPKRTLKHLLNTIHNKKCTLTKSQQVGVSAMKNLKRVIIESERCSGTTVMMVSYAIWYALTNPEQVILIQSSHSRILQLTMRAYLESLFGDTDCIFRKKSMAEYIFANGSRIMIRTTGVNVARGMNVSLYMMEGFDELSATVREELLYCIAPVVSCTNSKVVIQTAEPLQIPGYTQVFLERLPKEKPFC